MSYELFSTKFFYLNFQKKLKQLKESVLFLHFEKPFC